MADMLHFFFFGHTSTPFQLQNVKGMSEEMKKMRAQLEEDEQVASLMRGLRGQNLSDELFASADVEMRLVEVFSVNF